MNLLDTQSELFFWQEWCIVVFFVSADYLWILNRDPSQFLKHIGFAQWIYATVRLV